MSTTSFCNSNHILVGLGGTGGKILRAFKMRMFEEFHDDEIRKKQPVALLYVDSTDEMMPQDGKARPDFRVMGKDASFTRNEFLNIKAVDVEHILDHIGNYPSVKGIVNNVTAVKSAIGSLGIVFVMPMRDVRSYRGMLITPTFTYLLVYVVEQVLDRLLM